MNEDLEETIVLYAQAFGNVPDAESAKMLAVDPQRMDLMAQLAGQETLVRIEFNYILEESEDARQTLIAIRTNVTRRSPN